MLNITQRELLILLSLGDREMYGLEIQSRIQEITQRRITPGSLYPTLSSLKGRGLVTSRWGDERTQGARRSYYRLTPAGHSAVQCVLDMQSKLLGTEPPWSHLPAVCG